MSVRLWVTGLGLVTPLGTGVEATWSGLLRGQSAIGQMTLFDVGAQRVGLAAEVGEAGLPDGLPDAVSSSRTSRMALAAAREAMLAARIDPRDCRVGLAVGCTTGGMFETEELLARLHADPSAHEALAAMLSHPISATGDRLLMGLGPFARVRSVASACSSGSNAIVAAASWLLSGEVDAVVAGGSDGLCRLTLSGFNALGAIDPEPCRPFDRRRRGTSLGEGAGFLVIERADRARLRGVAPIAELAGWAMGAEAHHITNPASDGVAVAEIIGRAVARAGVCPGDIDYVSAHGTGTPLNDTMEASALRRALGAETKRIPVSSSKGQIGHTLGAAGAIDAAIVALVIARRTLVPTVGLEQPDPALDLVHVPRVGLRVPRVRAALSHAFGFGGMDTVLVFSEPGFASAVGRRASHPAGLDHPPSAEAEVIVTGVAIFGPSGLAGREQCDRLPGERFVRGVPVDPDAHLDAMRARRLDRGARLGTVAVQHALAEAGATASGTGLVLGSAFGNVDGCAEFMHRILEKGPRSASPAQFPNLVPSSPAGHVSIYLGMNGPVFATADLSVSGESAFAQAAQLVRAGEAPRIVAAALEPRSGIVDSVLATLFAHAASQAGTVRADLAVAVVLEDAAHARARGARALARVGQVIEWRGDGAAAALAALSAPRLSSAQVILARPDASADALVEASAWRTCDRVVCSDALGESDALGAAAIAVAAARLGAGALGEALVIGVARSRGFAIRLARP